MPLSLLLRDPSSRSALLLDARPGDRTQASMPSTFTPSQTRTTICAFLLLTNSFTTAMSVSILWADDEIDLLRPHVLFLQEKGYTVDTVNNGIDAVEKVKGKEYGAIPVSYTHLVQCSPPSPHRRQ